MAGKLQPLDPDVNDEGSVILTGRYRPTERGTHPECRALTKAEREPSLLPVEDERYMPHHATCPNAEDFRKRAAAGSGRLR